MAHQQLIPPPGNIFGPFPRPIHTTSSSELRSIAWHSSPSLSTTCLLQEHSWPASLQPLGPCALQHTSRPPLSPHGPSISQFLPASLGCPRGPKARTRMPVPVTARLAVACHRILTGCPSWDMIIFQIRRTWASSDSLPAAQTPRLCALKWSPVVSTLPQKGNQHLASSSSHGT